MRPVETSWPTAAENLAAEDALLEARDAAGRPEAGDGTASPAVEPLASDVFRVWESARPAVVVGRSGRLEREVYADECRRLGVPVLRRSTGGGTIVAGPGCLMYAVVLSTRDRPGLAQVDVAHRVVLDRVRAALATVGLTAEQRGSSDLTLAGEAADDDRGPARKFSGNAMRVGRRSILYHGTILYGFDLDLIGRLIPPPPKEPDYRGGRGHERFVRNAPLDRASLVAALRAEFVTDARPVTVPALALERWLAERYANPAWHARH